ncbi:MAG: hypothetical protein ACJ0Q1_08735 [Luminiphilus sp.]
MAANGGTSQIGVGQTPHTRGSTISEKAAGGNEASASTGVIGGRMMNNPKYITLAVVAVLFLFTGIAFGQWPDDLQQAAVVTAE